MLERIDRSLSEVRFSPDGGSVQLYLTDSVPPYGTVVLTCDNLLSAEVVTADGQVLKASDKEYDDLFWALRGGGGNFGVVTTFEYRMHPVAEIYGGPIAYPVDRAEDVLRFYRE